MLIYTSRAFSTTRKDKAPFYLDLADNCQSYVDDYAVSANFLLRKSQSRWQNLCVTWHLFKCGNGNIFSSIIITIFLLKTPWTLNYHPWLSPWFRVGWEKEEVLNSEMPPFLGLWSQDYHSSFIRGTARPVFRIALLFSKYRLPLESLRNRLYSDPCALSIWPFCYKRPEFTFMSLWGPREDMVESTSSQACSASSVLITTNKRGLFPQGLFRNCQRLLPLVMWAAALRLKNPGRTGGQEWGGGTTLQGMLGQHSRENGASNPGRLSYQGSISRDHDLWPRPSALSGFYIVYVSSAFSFLPWFFLLWRNKRQGVCVLGGGGERGGLDQENRGSNACHFSRNPYR